MGTILTHSGVLKDMQGLSLERMEASCFLSLYREEEKMGLNYSVRDLG